MTPVPRWLDLRSVRVGLLLFMGLCLYVPLSVPWVLLGYNFIWHVGGTTGSVDVVRWLLEVLALAALVTLAVSIERRASTL